MAALGRQGATTTLNKVPDVTIYFWIIKILATTVGETAADFLSTTLKLGLTGTSIVMSVLLILALVIQLAYRRYIPWIYWATVVLISVVGTLITDNLVDGFGVSLETTTIGFACTLAATFAAWYASERTLSIHTIFTTRRELFYWAAILFTFALGTAGGDLAAEGFSLGYAQAALIFGATIAVIALGHYFLKLDAILAFWTAYILTRQLGASIGDLLSQSTDNGGVGLGTVMTSGMFLVTIVVLVMYLTVGRNDQLPARPFSRTADESAVWSD
jgi:uncharacterized membrane-anchored protein